MSLRYEVHRKITEEYLHGRYHYVLKLFAPSGPTEYIDLPVTKAFFDEVELFDTIEIAPVVVERARDRGGFPTKDA